MSTICGSTIVVLILGVNHSPTTVREVTDRILADPAYEDGVRELVVSESAVRTLHDYLDRVGAWMRRLLDGLARLRMNQPVVFWLVMTVLFSVVGLILWQLARSLGLLLRTGASGATLARSPREARARRFRELWSEAQLSAERGDYTGAIRHLLLALLARAHDHRVPLSSGWTNREIVAFVARHRGLRRVSEPLEAFVGTFDRIWYGRERALESDYARCRELVSVCVRGLQGGEDERDP